MNFISISLIVLIWFYLVFLLAKKFYNDPFLYSYKSTINNSSSHQTLLSNKDNKGKCENNTSLDKE